MMEWPECPVETGKNELEEVETQTEAAKTTPSGCSICEDLTIALPGEEAGLKVIAYQTCTKFAEHCSFELMSMTDFLQGTQVEGNEQAGRLMMKLDSSFRGRFTRVNGDTNCSHYLSLFATAKEDFSEEEKQALFGKLELSLNDFQDPDSVFGLSPISQVRQKYRGLIKRHDSRIQKGYVLKRCGQPWVKLDQEDQAKECRDSDTCKGVSQAPGIKAVDAMDSCGICDNFVVQLDNSYNLFIVFVVNDNQSVLNPFEVVSRKEIEDTYDGGNAIVLANYMRQEMRMLYSNIKCDGRKLGALYAVMAAGTTNEEAIRNKDLLNEEINVSLRQVQNAVQAITVYEDFCLRYDFRIFRHQKPLLCCSRRKEK